jgi:O-antigen ligase
MPDADRRAMMYERILQWFSLFTAIQVISLFFSIAVSSISFFLAASLFVTLVVLDYRRTLCRNGLEWYFIAWAAAVILMVVFARYPVQAVTSGRKIMLIAVVYFMPVAFPTEERITRFLVWMAAVAGILSLFEIIATYAASMERLGFFQHYMTSGGMKMLLLLLLTPLAVGRNMGPRPRAIALAAMFVMLFALVLTQTRSSWLGFVAGILVIGVLRYRVVLAALVIVCVAFALLAPGKLMERVQNLTTTTAASGEGTDTIKSNMTRVRMWKTGWRMFLDRPVTGVGDGNMYEMYRQYVPDAIKDEGGHLHNTYVHVLACYGIIGFLAMLALFGAFGVREAIALRRGQRSFRGDLALGALAAFAGFLVNGLAEWNFGDHEIVVLLYMTVGLAVISTPLKTGAESRAAEA